MVQVNLKFSTSGWRVVKLQSQIGFPLFPRPFFVSFSISQSVCALRKGKSCSWKTKLWWLTIWGKNHTPFFKWKMIWWLATSLFLSNTIENQALRINSKAITHLPFTCKLDIHPFPREKDPYLASSIMGFLQWLSNHVLT